MGIKKFFFMSFLMLALFYRCSSEVSSQDEDIETNSVDVLIDAYVDVIRDVTSDVCIPDCTNIECGDNGCGGSCGKCENNTYCNFGKCEFFKYYFSKTYAGSNTDEATSIQQTSDGGFIVAGKTESFGNGWRDFWIIRLNSKGDIIWQKTFGGDSLDEATSIQQTSDGGFIVAGKTDSFGDGTNDFWVIRLNSKGDIIWQKTYGGSGDDYAYSIQQTSDGGFIVAGKTDSFGDGTNDFWIIRLNSNGEIIWQKIFGGDSTDEATSIQQTSDGGFIVAGKTESFGDGWRDFWIIKLNSNGNIIWQKTFGGDSLDEATSIQQTSDGGFIVAGKTDSFGDGDYDFWVIRLNSNGDIIWQKIFGGDSTDEATSIQQTSDGGFIVAGKTESFGNGWRDFWIMRLNSKGDIIWQKTFGGDSLDEATSIQQTSDGGFIVAGKTKSLGEGDYDLWIIKIDSDGKLTGNCGNIEKTSNAIFKNTNITPVNTSAKVNNTNIVPSNTKIISQNSNCKVQTQCFAP